MSVSTAASTLQAWGFIRPAEIVELAAAAGLELAVAAAMLERESGGGQNVWGHDAVDTGGVYTKGAPVDEMTYLHYRAALRAHQIETQGCGPAQLTDPSLQAAADALHGCFDWRSNVTVGFGHLAGLIRGFGLADGLRRYNGSGPPAERYRDQMLAAVASWRTRLGPGNTPTTPPAPSPIPRPRPAGDDDVAWTSAEGAPPVPDLYQLDPQGRPTHPPLIDPLWALANATAHAASARDAAFTAADRGADAARGIAVLAEAMRALQDTVRGIARLLAVPAAPVTSAAPFVSTNWAASNLPSVTSSVAAAIPAIDHAELVRQLLAQLGVTPAAPTPTPEGTPE